MSRGAGGDERLSPRDAAAVALLAALFLLPGLGSHDLWAPDEPRYAQVAREMLHGGDWLLPRLNDRVYTDKPPGWFWLAALASWPAGDVSAATARLPSALAAVALLTLVAVAGTRLVGRAAALRGAVVLATMYLFAEMSRSAHLDMLLALLVTAALFSARALFAAAAGLGARLLFWLALAAAALVKGPVGLLLPLLVAVADRLLAGRPRDLLRLQPAWGVLLAAGVPLLWLAAASVRPGYAAGDVLQRHVLSRFSEGLHHSRSVWYYAPQSFTEMAPWSFLVPAAALLAWRRRQPAVTPEREDEAVSPPAWPPRRFLLVWVAVILVFFSLAAEKRGLYLLPLLPAAALLVGDLWASFGGPTPATPAVRRLVAAGFVAAAAGFLLVGGAPVLLRRWPELQALLGWRAWLLGSAAGAGGLALAVLLLRRRWAAAAWVQTAGMAAVLLLHWHLIQPALDPFKSARPLAQRLAAEVSSGAPVAMLEWRAAYLYFSGVHMDELDSDAAALDWMRQPGPRYLLLAAEHFQRLQPRLVEVELIAADDVGHRRMLLVAKRPPPPARR